MKQSSVEQKAKAYDEAYKKVAIRFGSNVAKEIFSEYEESEDDRIRNFLIKQANSVLDSITDDDEEVPAWKSALAWLEKQGNLMKALQISNARIGELIEKNFYLKEQLEKQVENNMGISEATKQELEDNLNKALEKETPESCNEFLDEQSCKEENSKERNICDTCEDSNGCLIPCCAKLLEKQGEQKSVFEMKTPEESLGIDSETYNKIVDECVYGEQKPDEWHREDEQNLNACLGYIPDEYLRRWLTDAIHVKYDKPNELPKGEDYGIDGLYAAIDILQKTLGEVDGYQTDDGILTHKCAISAVKELSKQKPSWSEEDIELLDNTIKFIEDRVAATSPSLRTYSPTLTGKEIPFLKALKERVQQQKQEWSDVDKDILFRTIDNLKFLRDTISIDPNYAINIINIEREITWLNSLRPQYKYAYNPYKAVVESIAEMCKHYDKASHSGLRDFYDNVKVKCKDAKEYDSLFPQSQWKPSDEQMLAINTAINVLGKGTINGKCLIELQEQLKKLREE